MAPNDALISDITPNAETDALKANNFEVLIASSIATKNVLSNISAMKTSDMAFPKPPVTAEVKFDMRPNDIKEDLVLHIRIEGTAMADI
jgi:hypothetical protein